MHLFEMRFNDSFRLLERDFHVLANSNMHVTITGRHTGGRTQLRFLDCFRTIGAGVMTRSMRLLRGAQGLVCSRTHGYLVNRPLLRNIRRYSDYVPTGTTARTTVNTLPFSSSVGKSHKSSEWVDVPPSGATVQVGTGLESSSTEFAFSSVMGSDGPRFSNFLLRDSCKYKRCMTSMASVSM